MLIDFLREVVVLSVGKGNEEIADLLNSTKYQNEFIIAKKLGITINQTRNLLYKISDNGLVVSERKKDKKKGWYTYYWKFDIMKCLEFLKKKLLDTKEKFEIQVNRRELSQFYVCQYCNIEFSSEESMNMDFTCDECGELLTLKDDSNLIKSMKKNIEKIDEQLISINVEIEVERKKLDKKKEKSLKLEEEEKEKKKQEAKEKREKKKLEKLALEAKEGKKIVAKKTNTKKDKIKTTETKKIKLAVKKESSKKTKVDSDKNTLKKNISTKKSTKK